MSLLITVIVMFAIKRLNMMVLMLVSFCDRAGKVKMLKMHSIIGKCSFINWCQKVQQDHHGDWQPQQQWQRHHQHQHGVSLIKICTGWPKSKFANSNGYTFENTHIWSHIGKAKMCFRGLHLYLVSSPLFTIFRNKCRPSKHILALTTWGQKYIFSEL